MPDLVGLGLALIVLDIHTWIARLGCLEDDVTTGGLPGLTEKLLTNLEQVSEPDASGFTAHLAEEFLNRSHAEWHQ